MVSSKDDTNQSFYHKHLWFFLDIPVTTPFQTASSLFSAESGDPESSSAFDQITK